MNTIIPPGRDTCWVQRGHGESEVWRVLKQGISIDENASLKNGVIMVDKNERHCFVDLCAFHSIFCKLPTKEDLLERWRELPRTVCLPHGDDLVAINMSPNITAVLKSFLTSHGVEKANELDFSNAKLLQEFDRFLSALEAMFKSPKQE